MLTTYLEAAMRSAHHELLPDDGQFYGEIPQCNGVYATAASLEERREQLREVLEEWVLFRLHRNLTLPVVAGVELAVKDATV
jgi:predicted RNase H-like HicB family nuclease